MSVSFGAEARLITARLTAFDVPVEISFWDTDPALARRAVGILSQDFKRMQRDWHAWKASALVAMNQGIAHGQTMTVDDSMLALVNQAKIYYRGSEGLYNPAIGQLIAVWGFYSDLHPSGAPPDKPMITKLVSQNPTMDDIVVSGHEVSSRNPAVQLDFSGFARGYAVDLAIKRLHELGVANALINISGDMRVIGRHGNRPWRAGIRHQQGNGIQAWLETRNNEAVFTSRNYLRNREQNSNRYPYTIDPRTGFPVKDVVSVTVVHANGALADAAATALTIAGINSWQRIARGMGIKTVMLVDDKGVVYMTRSMANRIHFSGKPPSQKIVDNP